MDLTRDPNYLDVPIEPKIVKEYRNAVSTLENLACVHDLGDMKPKCHSIRSNLNRISVCGGQTTPSL
jgi:hypothetical protein